MALIIAAVEGVCYTTAYLIWRDAAVHMTFMDVALATASCVIGVSGYLCYFESILEGQVAIVGTISAAYPALVVVGAMLFLGEGLTVHQAMGVVAIIAGVMVLSYEPDPGAAHSLSKRSLSFALMAFMAWGIWSLTQKVAIEAITPGNMFGFYVVSALTAPVLYAWARRVRPAPSDDGDPTRLIWVVGGLALFLNFIGAISYTFALGDGNASLVVPVTSAYPIITALVAVALLKERVSWVQGVALVVVVAGLVMVGLTV